MSALNSLRAAFVGGVVLALASAHASAAAKQYQVTGKLLEVSEKMLTVEKGDEKWEIDRTPDLKVTGTLKAGEKVTIYYHMVADKAEIKPEKK